MTDTAVAGCLSPEVERLLCDVLADGFTIYCCGPKTEPVALIAAYEWPHWVDLLTIRDFDRIAAARMPKRSDNVDVFAPEVVVWAYEGTPQCTLRALLDLVHPQHPDVPHGEFAAPRSLHIRRAEQRPMAVRLPSLGRAAERARRLAPISVRNAPPTPLNRALGRCDTMSTVPPATTDL